MTLYYKYRDYPINQINNKHKRNQLKTIYGNIFSRLSLYFHIQCQYGIGYNNCIPFMDDKNNKQQQKQRQSFIISGSGSGLDTVNKHSTFNLHSNSKLFVSSNKVSSPQLKSQVLSHSNTEQSLSSMSVFRKQDRPIDQQFYQQLQNLIHINTLLKIIINTSIQTIWNVINHQTYKQLPEQPSILEMEMNNQQNSQKSKISYPMQNTTHTSSTINDSLQQCIVLQTIPFNHQQLQYYFLSFCAKFTIKNRQFLLNQQNLINTKKDVKLDHLGYRLCQDGSRWGKSQKSNKKVSKNPTKQNITAKSQISLLQIVNINKQKNYELDEIIISILNNQLQFSNTFLSKFQTNRKQSRSFNNGLLNIIIQTWLQILALTQSSSVLFQIINELVKSSLSSNANPFIQKIVSYLHFVTLVSTKSLLAKTVSKQNFLWFIPELISGTRSLKDFNLQKSQGLIKLYDVSLERYVYSADAYDKTMQRWAHIGCIVSEILTDEQNIFWVKTFQNCCQLLDKYLQQKVQFSYSLIVLYEKLQQNCSQLIKIPENMRRNYRKSLKIILQKQIGHYPFSFSRNSYSTNKINLKSKISLNTNQQNQNIQSKKNTNRKFFTNIFGINFADFIKIRNNYTFYDDKKAESQQKIYQLKQWEKVVKQGISKLRGYKKLLDLGLKIFEGVPQCIIAFFLQGYFNFKKIQATTNFNFLQIVKLYCHKIKHSNILGRIQQNNKQNKINSPIITQFQLHKETYKSISKQISQTFYSKQLSKQQLVVYRVHSNITSNISNNSNLENQKNQQNQNSLFQYTNPQNNQNINNNNLVILNDQIIVSLIEKIGQFQSKIAENDNVYLHRSYADKKPIDQQSQCLKIGQQLNLHISLLNQCNYILNNIQKSQNINNSQIQLQTTKPFLLNSQQLKYSLILLQKQQQNHIKIHLTQTQQNRIHSTYNRKISNPNRIGRMSNTNSLIIPTNKKNSLAEQGKSKKQEQYKNQQNQQNLQIQYKKIKQIMIQHNTCLQLIIEVYCKYQQYYKILVKNIICEYCASQKKHYTLQQRLCNKILNIKQQYKNNTSTCSPCTTKFLSFIQKYLAIKKQIKNNTINQIQCYTQNYTNLLILQLELKKQLQVIRLNNQIFMMFMYIASLKIDSQTFLAIYKQDIISEEKKQKVRVIGKIYYDEIHLLFLAAKQFNKVKNRQQQFQQKKNIYLQYLLVILISLIQLLYERLQDSNHLNPYTHLLTNYFTSKCNLASDSQYFKSVQQLINLTKIISQCLDCNQHQRNLMLVSEKQLILKLLQLRILTQSSKITQRLNQIVNQQIEILKKYRNGNQWKIKGVEYLRKKLLYLMLREVYFDSYYDTRVFQPKTRESRKNFFLYQTKMFSFFQQIIQKDQQQFSQLKSQQLKQRSAHLKGYLIDYQKQPVCLKQQKEYLIKIVCLFNKTLNLLTQNKEFEMKKRSSNSISVNRKSKKKKQPIYIHYVSKQFIKPNNQRVRVFQNESFYFFRAIQIYEDILSKKVQECQRKYSTYKQIDFIVPDTICIKFTSNDLQTIEINKQSLLALWINQQYKNLHEYKMMLSHQNYQSKLQKLYIDLDVRHKVFQSFKDKILNYQMQKTKIYHQYMDYIRGLKLDVYSHVTGENPFPYFKLINAIKIYRLDVKKKQLQQKIDEEFGKNLGKWNEGIVKDMKQYMQWILKQLKVWQKLNENSNKSKKQMLEIFGIVNKQLKRQQTNNIQKIAKSIQNKLRVNICSKNISIRKSVYKHKNQSKI